MIFILGIIVGLLAAILVVVVAVRYKVSIVKHMEQAETLFKKKEKVSIIRRKTNAQEAYESILEANKARGGITDHELHETN